MKRQPLPKWVDVVGPILGLLTVFAWLLCICMVPFFISIPTCALTILTLKLCEYWDTRYSDHGDEA